jgi:hypothetical protein
MINAARNKMSMMKETRFMDKERFSAPIEYWC